VVSNRCLAGRPSASVSAFVAAGGSFTAWSRAYSARTSACASTIKLCGLRLQRDHHIRSDLFLSLFVYRCRGCL